MMSRDNASELVQTGEMTGGEVFYKYNPLKIIHNITIYVWSSHQCIVIRVSFPKFH